ncbi:hypothetical protein J2X97_001251 [Epilithonimonas hungarica]|uniref:hypothetical protein n=1 Tax=Epilithonimonas hungarica TaxID=454006 RepID=UPI0027814B26|nr:hypothetical protein [Epilithonimonas hungarica]MDP9955614.1 hypothetical protein [Epilithonimonas hungarica]
MRNRIFLETKFTFYSSIVIILLVILSVWISGNNSHHTLFQNSILSTSILAIAFFLFVSISLYKGVGLRDNLGKIFTKENFNKRMKSTSDFTPDIDFPLMDAEGIGGIILSILAWIAFTVLALFVLYFVGVFFWSVLLLLLAILYWIYFRALKLIFKNSKHCKDNLFKSLGFGIFYSGLYVSWIYGIIFLLKYI